MVAARKRMIFWRPIKLRELDLTNYQQELETPMGDCVDGSSAEEVVEKREPVSFSCIFEALVFIIFSCMYLANVGSDCWAAYLYLTDQNNWHFWATFVIVVVNLLVMMCMNMYYLYLEYKDQKEVGAMVGTWVWCLRVCGTLLFLGPLIRCIEGTCHSILRHRSKTKSRRALHETLMHMQMYDISVLGIIDCFIDSAPQLMLQLYIVTTQGPEREFKLYVQMFSCLSSWISCASSLTSFARVIRVVRDDKECLKFPSIVLIFCWRVFTIGPRILALSLFASVFHINVFVIMSVHWFVMLLYLMFRKREGICNDLSVETFFNSILAFVLIFDFWNTVEGHTRYRYVMYYILVYVENVIMVLLWFMYTEHAGRWFYLPALLFVVVGFIVGIAFMLFHYLSCHPETIKLFIPCKNVRNESPEGMTPPKRDTDEHKECTV